MVSLCVCVCGDAFTHFNVNSRTHNFYHRLLGPSNHFLSLSLSVSVRVYAVEFPPATSNVLEALNLLPGKEKKREQTTNK